MNKSFIYSLLLFVVIFAHSAILAQAIPRPEYPRPQFERADWINLNGAWTYTIDGAGSGFEKELNKSKGFDSKIIVPFVPESKLSGVEHKDFINHLWYHRSLEIPAAWTGKKILLNFGAVYYLSEIYIDGQFVMRHFGGTSSFSTDISSYVKAGGRHDLVVYVHSELRDQMQPGGKQSTRLYSHVCNYTRSTGIWQTVWMEAVDKAGLKQVQVTPDIDQEQIVINPSFYSTADGRLDVTVKSGGKPIAKASMKLSSKGSLIVPLKKPRLWSPEDPFLYDLVYEVYNTKGERVDLVNSYMGMRKVHAEGNIIFLNNKPLYQRLVLDQGYYADGIWTAPTDQDLKRDIELAMACGFNGARLHQKVFEERFHYWADKLGYLTWGESSSWGLDYNRPEAARIFTPEWIEILERDRNHPSIIAWVSNNEQNNIDRVNFPKFMHDIYKLTKLIDPSRLFIGNSGGTHFACDVYTVHNYAQDSIDLKKQIWNEGKLMEAHRFEIEPRLLYNTGSNFPLYANHFNYLNYDGTIPYMLDEFGGVMYSGKSNPSGWGYGGTASQQEFYKKVGGMVNGILDLSPSVWGYCYTQLTDVEQEQNGLFYYDRSPKFDLNELRKIFSKKRK